MVFNFYKSPNLLLPLDLRVLNTSNSVKENERKYFQILKQKETNQENSFLKKAIVLIFHHLFFIPYHLKF